MARIRSIKPEFWEDELTASLTIQARLIFIGTWNFADDQGVLPASLKFIKSKIFPYDDSLREHHVKTWVDQLITCKMLIPFFFDGKSYFFIRNFSKHQLIDKRYCKYIIPKQKVDEILENIDLHVNTSEPQSEHHVATTRLTSEHLEGGERIGEDMEMESKGKVRDNVTLLPSEISKLEESFSKNEIDWMYDKLSAYKLSKGKKYKSDYGAILTWVVDSLKEEKEKNSGKKEKGNDTEPKDLD